MAALSACALNELAMPPRKSCMIVAMGSIVVAPFGAGVEVGAEVPPFDDPPPPPEGGGVGAVAVGVVSGAGMGSSLFRWRLRFHDGLDRADRLQELLQGGHALLERVEPARVGVLAVLPVLARRPRGPGR